VLLLLRPLLLDVVPSVSQTACIALARMAEASPQIAEDIIKIDILPDIVDSIAYQNVTAQSFRDFSRNVPLFCSRLLLDITRSWLKR
jgi:hypothetical protein